MTQAWYKAGVSFRHTPSPCHQASSRGGCRGRGLHPVLSSCFDLRPGLSRARRSSSQWLPESAARSSLGGQARTAASCSWTPACHPVSSLICHGQPQPRGTRGRRSSCIRPSGGAQGQVPIIGTLPHPPEAAPDQEIPACQHEATFLST
jgi:hypothetical protein